MTLQRRLLHTMLGILALAAVAGVSTIFLTDRGLIARISGTLFLAAGALALALPVSKKLSIQHSRTLGLISLLAIVIGFFLALAALWETVLFQTSSWDLSVTTLAYISTVTPSLAFLSLYARPGGRAAGASGIGFSVAIFFSWLMAIWRDPYVTGSLSDWSKTAELLAVAILPMSASLFGTFPQRRHWRLLGSLAAALGIVLGLIGIWFVSGGKPELVNHCFIVATVVGGANLLVRASLPRSQAWLPLVTTAMLLVTGVLGILVNHLAEGAEWPDIDDLSLRLLAAAAIVTCCGVLAIAILLSFNRRVMVTDARSIAAITSIFIHCPRCAKKQMAALDKASCPGCGLIFLLKLAEPRCQNCNYALLDINSGRCPECGEPIFLPPSSPLPAAKP